MGSVAWSEGGEHSYVMSKKRQEDIFAQTGGGERGSKRFVRYCFVLLLTGVVVLVWLSLLSFSPTDAPSPAVHPPQTPVVNAAGPIGAHLAYYLRYWVGAGVYMGVLFATVAAITLMFGGRIGFLRWRVLGVAFLVIATSTAVYVHQPTESADALYGSAGVAGMAAGKVLLGRFGPTGAWILVAITLCIGLMLAADNLVLQLPSFSKKVWAHRDRLPSMVGKLRRRIPHMVTADAGSVEVTASPRAAAAVPIKSSRQAAERRGSVESEPASPRAKLTSLLGIKQTAAGQETPSPQRVTAPQQPTRIESDDEQEYSLPSTDLLAEPSGGYTESQELQAEQKRTILRQTLDDFGVDAEIVGYMTGPVITLFELSLGAGVKVAVVSNLANDIARSLAVPGVRIVSPLPGRDTIGIEVPNLDKEIVRIKELMQMAPKGAKRMHLPLYLGKDAGGNAIVADLAAMPHMLIAGTTGSGKSVCINSIITAILMTRRPEEVGLILIDPKMVEMAAFENIPHLLCPIVHDARKAEEILEWAAMKMDERYELLKEANVKNIVGYNRLSPAQIYERFGIVDEAEKSKIPTHLRYYVIIVDELADLVMTASKEVENHIIRIAQKARAVGIHMLLSTQRPSVNVVTGLIKSNMPCRISFRVASRQESRIVLDQNGADVLLGEGDMLFLQPGTSNLIRAQGTYVDDSEIRAVVEALRRTGAPQYNAELMRLTSRPVSASSGERDEFFDQAVDLVLATQRGSVSLLQRRLQIGYSRASRIIDQMADAGLLGEYKGSQARECLMTLEEWEHLHSSIAADQSGASALNGQPTSV